MKRVLWLGFFVMALGLASFYAPTPSTPTWCKKPAPWAYWRSPFPEEHRGLLERDLGHSLNDGCFDGRKWTREEIRAVLSRKTE